MNYYCYCGRVAFIETSSAMLLLNLFQPILHQRPIVVLCEECGKGILNGYKDTYGIGIQ